MVLGNLGKSFGNVLKKIANAIFIDKKLVNEITKEIQKTLLESDVDISLIFSITEEIKKKALDEKIPGFEKKEILLKLIHDKLVEILGEEKFELKISKGELHKIMFIGLYGSGKTTTISKLAFYYSKRGYKTAVVGLDVYRPAAPEQLKQMAEKGKFSYFIDVTEKKPEKIWKKYEKELKKFDLILIDTAGRDALNKDLINELWSLEKLINPDNVILVMPADIGQTAKKQASEFKKVLNIGGVIITRMDGTAKGGGALISCHETNAKVYFIGVGEKLQDIEKFNPTSFVSQLLGMGDLNVLIEKARTALDEKQLKKTKKRVEEGRFSLEDMCSQIENMQKIGPLGKIAQLIPGMGKIKLPENLLSIQEEKLKRWKHAIDSMTFEEKENPSILSTSRISRISKGGHVPTNEIREMLKQYKMIKDLLGKGLDPSKMDEKQMMKLAKKFKGKLPKGLKF